MRRLPIGLAAAAALVGAGLAAPKLLWSEARLRPAMEAALADWMGVPVRIDGPVGLSVFPLPQVAASSIRVDMPAGGPHIDLGRMEARLALAPLLFGQVDPLVTTFIEPVVRFGSRPATASGSDGRREPATARPPGHPPAAPARVAVVNGRLEWPGVGGLVVRVPLDLEAQVRIRADMASISGESRIGRQPVRFDLEVGDPGGFGGGAATPVGLRVAWSDAGVRFDGTVVPGDEGPRAQGRAAAKIPNLPAFLRDVLGIGVEAVPVGRLDLEADVFLTPRESGLSGITGLVDGADAAGAFRSRWADRPGIEGWAELGRLPLDRVAAALSSAALNRTDPWDIDLRLRLAGLSWRQLDAGISDLTMRRTADGFRVELADTALLDGTVAATLAIAEGPEPSVGLDLRANAVDAEPLTTALAGRPLASGQLRGRLVLRGGDPRSPDWMRTLDGGGAFGFSNGKIHAGVLGLPREVPLQELTATLSVQSGAVLLDPLSVAAPGQQVEGRGRIDLSGRAISLTLTGAGQGALPAGSFRIEGPLGAERLVGGDTAPPAGTVDAPSPPVSRPSRAVPPVRQPGAEPAQPSAVPSVPANSQPAAPEPPAALEPSPPATVTPVPSVPAPPPAAATAPGQQPSPPAGEPSILAPLPSRPPVQAPPPGVQRLPQQRPARQDPLAPLIAR